MEIEKKPVKKVWKTPELIVLVRNKPEEAVLQGCKGLSLGPYASDSFCSSNSGCFTCEINSGS